MANAKQCDRCGKFYVDLDLCQKCLDEFAEWMKPINERA